MLRRGCGIQPQQDVTFFTVLLGGGGKLFLFQPLNIFSHLACPRCRPVLQHLRRQPAGVLPRPGEL